MPLLFSETIAAINGTITAGFEGDLAGLAAFSAYSIIHLAGAAVVSARVVALAGVTASFAALGLVGETFFCVKFLFAGSESEFVSAIFADQCFVVVHEIPL